jgi:hypothetical protein
MSNFTIDDLRKKQLAKMNISTNQIEKKVKNGNPKSSRKDTIQKQMFLDAKTNVKNEKEYKNITFVAYKPTKKKDKDGETIYKQVVIQNQDCIVIPQPDGSFNIYEPLLYMRCNEGIEDYITHKENK